MHENKKIDRNIQQLLEIRLGLEKKSEKLFVELLGSRSDPLSDIFKNMTEQKHQIAKMKTLLLQSNSYNNRLEIIIASQLLNGTELIKKAKQQKAVLIKEDRSELSQNPFNSSGRSNITSNLPSNFEQSMQKIEDKKTVVRNLRGQYEKQVQNFQVFLLKCIREVLKTQVTNKLEVENSVKNLEQQLKKEKVRVLQFEQMDRSEKMKLDSVLLEQKKKKQNDLGEILKNVKEYSNCQEKKEELFTKISSCLGLESIWSSYIEKLKVQSQIYNLYQKSFEKIDLSQTVLVERTGISFESKSQQTRDLNKNKNISFSQKLKTIKSNWFKKLEEQYQKQVKQIQNPQGKTTHLVDQILRQKTLKIGKSLEEPIKLINGILDYFYQKFDKLFQRHNQHPPNLSGTMNERSLRQKIQRKIKDGQWKEAQKLLQQQIDEKFYNLERKTMFFSANRMILRKRQ